MTITLLLLIHFSLIVFVYCYSENRYDPLERAFNIRYFTRSATNDVMNKDISKEYSYSPVYVGIHEGSKDADKISTLPGQPTGVDFNQYSGYVTIDPNHGKTLFYYLVESPVNSSTNPLVLWLNGGPGCSSFGYGAMTELGPFRVNPDNTTLSRNKYAWNNVANVLFLETPAGVGFSYSNTSSDYEIGDSQTIKDTYTFLVNWLTRFPEYKNRDFYMAGQNHAAHYIPQIAQIILQNKSTNQIAINLKGIILGNAYMDYETARRGFYDYIWTHAIISDELHSKIMSNCNFSKGAITSWKCQNYKRKAIKARGNINIYDIYALSCPPTNNNTFQTSGFDPCSIEYVFEYLNNATVQESLHAKSTEWDSCSDFMLDNYTDSPPTVLPVVQDVMASGICVWIYSGDTDSYYSVTQTRYDIKKLQTSVKTPWYPWTCEGEVGGYVVEYQNLTFVTIRGAGNSVPSNQPARSLVVFTSFLQGKLP